MDEPGDGPVVASSAIWARPGESAVIGGITARRVVRMLDEAAATQATADRLEVENVELRRRVDALEGYLYGEPTDAGDGPLPDRVLELHERADGRWSAEIACTDGVIRWFRSALARPRQVRRPIPPKVRYQIFERAGFRCTYCGKPAEEDALVVDHVIAVANGGTDDPDNLVAACQECNIGKGAR